MGWYDNTRNLKIILRISALVPVIFFITLLVLLIGYNGQNKSEVIKTVAVVASLAIVASGLFAGIMAYKFEQHSDCGMIKRHSKTHRSYQKLTHEYNRKTIESQSELRTSYGYEAIVPLDDVSPSEIPNSGKIMIILTSKVGRMYEFRMDDRPIGCLTGRETVKFVYPRTYSISVCDMDGNAIFNEDVNIDRSLTFIVRKSRKGDFVKIQDTPDEIKD